MSSNAGRIMSRFKLSLPLTLVEIEPTQLLIKSSETVLKMREGQSDGARLERKVRAFILVRKLRITWG